MILKLIFIALAGSVFWLPLAAKAQVAHGKWVLESSKKDCFISQIKPNGDKIVISLANDGKLAVAAASSRWDIGQGERVNVEMRYPGGGKSWWNGARGFLNGQRAGFTFNWSSRDRAPFLRKLRSGAHFDLHLNKQNVGRFSLSGSSAAVDGMQRCAGQIVIKSANTLTAEKRTMVGKINRNIHLDSLKRWRFLRYDPDSVWTIELVKSSAQQVIYRAHYTYNRGVKGWVDVKHNSGGTCHAYWDRPTFCVSMEKYG